MKIAIRRILVTLVWLGLPFGYRSLAQDLTAPQPMPLNRMETIPPGDRATPVTPDSTQDTTSRPPGVTVRSTTGDRPNPPATDSAAGRAGTTGRYGDWVSPSTPDSTSDSAPENDTPVVGEHQMPIGGLFGDTASPACEWCGGGNCLPPAWTVNNSVALMALSRPNNERWGANSLPAGPVSAGSVVVTESGVQTQQNFNQYVNDALQYTQLETHTPIISESPSWNLTLSRFLGRDGEARDHFLEASFTGLQSYSAAMTVHGSTIPFYSTTPQLQAIPATPPVVLYYQGSLVSPAPIFLPVNGQQQALIQPAYSALGRNYDLAFNRSDLMSTSFTSNFNEFEVNYRFAGHNQPDQLVLNPNGRWYRECQAGYYYSYFFGAKMMVINETFDFQSSGSQYASVGPDSVGSYAPAPTAQFTHAGDYSVQSYNTLVGLQTGGKLEYRFCRWCLDTHGNAGMFLNFAHQYSHITTSFTGAPDPSQIQADSIIPAFFENTDETSIRSHSGVAFAGGFGVTGSYKFYPNLIGHASYDMLFVGDVARASEQVIFSTVPETSRNLIYTNGAVFYNGVSFGVEWDW